MSVFRTMRGMSYFALIYGVSGLAVSQEIPSETPNKKQAEAAANTAEKAIVAPLPAGNAKLDALRALIQTWPILECLPKTKSYLINQRSQNIWVILILTMLKNMSQITNTIIRSLGLKVRTEDKAQDQH